MLPVIVSLLKAKKGDLLIIENPEAHLHPKGQRQIGELAAKAATNGVQVIMETHSDHVLNGVRLSVKQKNITSEQVGLHYFGVYKEDGIWKHEKTSPEILRRLRVFKLPDKSEEFFSWHISFSGDFPGRIHFIPDAQRCKGIIGYVGKHLPTKNYVTI